MNEKVKHKKLKTILLALLEVILILITALFVLTGFAGIYLTITDVYFQQRALRGGESQKGLPADAIYTLNKGGYRLFRAQQHTKTRENTVTNHQKPQTKPKQTRSKTRANPHRFSKTKPINLI
jgi:hypothetical protein